MAADTDPVPLDGAAEFTELERRGLRVLLQEASHRRWLGKRIAKWVGVAVSAAVAIWGGVEWAVKHVRLNP